MKRWMLYIGAVLVVSSTALAGTIDDFSTSSVVTDPAGGGATTDGGIAILVGPFDTRTLSAVSDGAGPIDVRTDSGRLALEAGFNTTGSATAIFSGAGPIDLSSATAFQIDFLGADFAGADVFLEVIDSSFNSSGLLDFSGAGTLGSTGSLLSIAVGDISGSVDLSSVSSLTLSFSTGAALSNDLAFDNFRTSDVPEPTSLLLFGGGLAAALFARRRRS